VERRSSNYANDLAARLNDVGMAYQALNDPLQAATYFRDAVALVRTFMGQNCASRLKLAQVLGNQFAAEVQQLLALSLESDR
jgi:Holliday junction resolvasome RuvABC endonuclease subunit